MDEAFLDVGYNQADYPTVVWIIFIAMSDLDCSSALHVHVRVSDASAQAPHRSQACRVEHHCTPSYDRVSDLGMPLGRLFLGPVVMLAFGCAGEETEGIHAWDGLIFGMVGWAYTLHETLLGIVITVG